MRIPSITSSNNKKSSNLFAWSFGFSLAFVFVVMLILWLLQPRKEEKFSYIEVQEPKPSPEPPPVEPEDLTRIEGVGPKINVVLQEAGITSYALLSKTEVDQLKAILKTARLSRFNPETWPEQAALAAKGDWEGLTKLQDELQAGRRA